VGEGNGDGDDTLRASIEAHGVLRPVVIDERTGATIDGGKMAEFARELGLDVETKTIRTDDPEIARIRINSAGRCIPVGVALTRLALTKLPELRATAKANKGAGQKAVGPAGDVSEMLAALLHGDGSSKSSTTAEHVIAVVERAPDLAQQIIASNGTLSPKAAHAILRERERAARNADIAADVPSLPEDKYDVITGDLPWQYDDGGIGRRGAAENHYPTMSLDHLCAMRPQIDKIAADDSMLALWATSPLLPDALRVMEAWGFKYISSAIWRKTGRIGMGHTFRIDHEFLLVGRRGAGIPVAARDVRSIIEAPVGKHSEKPKKAFDALERLWPSARKIELFARRKRDGWTIWGAEAPTGEVAA